MNPNKIKTDAAISMLKKQMIEMDEIINKSDTKPIIIDSSKVRKCKTKTEAFTEIKNQTKEFENVSRNIKAERA